MLPVTALCVGMLGLLVWRAGRTILFPPALFCGVWFITLAGLFLAERNYLPVSERACEIFLVGAIAFAAGALLALQFVRDPSQLPQRSVHSARVSRAALDLLLLALIGAFPYYLHLAMEIGGSSNGILVLREIRQRLVLANGESPFGIAGNLNVIAILVAAAMVFESDGTWQRRARAVMAVTLALAYSALTGSKGGALCLMTLFFVSQVRGRRIKVAAAAGAASIILVFFAAGLFAVNLAANGPGDYGSATRMFAAEVGSYWLGPPVAFSAIVSRPESMASSENIGRFFMQTARSLGMNVDVPSINLPYTAITQDGDNTNTYTIYVSYFKDYAWTGTILLLGGLGVALTLIWSRAMAGAPVAVLMYAQLCTAVVLSIYSENFFLGLNGYIKSFALYLLLYELLPRVVAPRVRTGSFA